MDKFQPGETVRFGSGAPKMKIRKRADTEDGEAYVVDWLDGGIPRSAVYLAVQLERHQPVTADELRQFGRWFS